MPPLLPHLNLNHLSAAATITYLPPQQFPKFLKSLRPHPPRSRPWAAFPAENAAYPSEPSCFFPAYLTEPPALS